jgi:hypothetical protein
MATRVAWLVAGLAWAARSVIEFARPEYYDPVSLLDWSAVWSYTAAWLLSALAVPLLARSVGSSAVVAVSVAFMVAAVVAGSANALEDALDQSWGGTPYVIGFLVAWLSLIPLTVLVWRAGSRRLAVLPLALFVSVALFNSGGGVVVLAAAVAFAVAPRWFEATPRPTEGRA